MTVTPTPRKSNSEQPEVNLALRLNNPAGFSLVVKKYCQMKTCQIGLEGACAEIEAETGSLAT
jgi:hypothetical protein